MTFHSILKSLLFVSLCLTIDSVAAQGNSSQDKPNPMSPNNPVVTPTPPLPPSSTPSRRPVDSTSIQVPPSQNQPRPVPISPQKHKEDSMFRSIEQNPPPLKIDTVGPNK